MRPEPIYRQRLLRLADHLAALPKGSFRFSHWQGNDWPDRLDDRPGACGTTACALGWATTIPEFRALGLRMARGQQPHIQHDPDGAPWRAASVVFGLDYGEFRALFIPNASGFDVDLLPLGATVDDVVARIRAFVAGHAGRAKRGNGNGNGNGNDNEEERG